MTPIQTDSTATKKPAGLGDSVTCTNYLCLTVV